MSICRKIAHKKRDAQLGQVIEVLVEDTADADGYVLVGRHPGQAPEVDGCTYLTSSTAQKGDFVKARVTQVSDHDLVAEPVADIIQE